MTSRSSSDPCDTMLSESNIQFKAGTSLLYTFFRSHSPLKQLKSEQQHDDLPPCSFKPCCFNQMANPWPGIPLQFHLICLPGIAGLPLLLGLLDCFAKHIARTAVEVAGSLSFDSMHQVAKISIHGYSERWNGG